MTRVCAGPWQVMLKQADSSYACVAESETRFTLSEVCILFAKLNFDKIYLMLQK